MVTSRAETVEAYLRELPAERRSAIEQVRKLIRKHLPRGYQEVMLYGMISYVVPLSRYPKTYNGQPLTVAALASQKNYMSIYLTGIYANADLRAKFEAAFVCAGKRLDAGSSCVRFKQLDDLALDALAEAIEQVPVDDLIAMSEAAHGGKSKASPAKKRAVKKTNAKAKAAGNARRA